MLDFARFLVDDHQACFVAMFGRMECDFLFRKFKFELR